MAEFNPEQYRASRSYEFHVKMMPVTPERAEELRRLKRAGRRQQWREEFVQFLPRYLPLIAVALVIGVLIGRFLLP